MMGSKKRQFAPLIHVSFQELVPADHFYRQLERTLDLSFVRQFVQETYAAGGRLSIDPMVFFEAIVEQCQQAGLVWGRELYIDVTKVQDNASKDSLKPRFAVEAYLEELFATEANEELPSTVNITEPASVAPPTSLPVFLSDEAREELSQSNEARQDWIEHEGVQDRRVTGRYYQRLADSQMSTTDPDATLMETTKGADMGYRTRYVFDGGKARVILGVLVTPSEVMDNQPMRVLIFRVRFRWKLQPRYVTGDSKYGTTDNIVALEPEHIHAYIPTADLTQRTLFFVKRTSTMTPSTMSTCVRQAKNCIWIGLIQPSVLYAIAHAPRTAITVRSKRSVLRANKNAASVAVSMRSIWIE
jgi:hypothetical protein